MFDFTNTPGAGLGVDPSLRFAWGMGWTAQYVPPTPTTTEEISFRYHSRVGVYRWYARVRDPRYAPIKTRID